jgi:hypothetical protein
VGFLRGNFRIVFNWNDSPRSSAVQLYHDDFLIHNRVYFEDWVLTEHPGAEAEMMTLPLEPMVLAFLTRAESLSR